MRNHVVRKIFKCGVFSYADHGFEDCRMLCGSINAGGRRGRQADVRIFFQNDVRQKVIASQHSSRRVQQHQIGPAIRKSKRGQRLQREGEARLREDRILAAPRKAQLQEAVAPDAFWIPLLTRKAANGGSTR